MRLKYPAFIIASLVISGSVAGICSIYFAPRFAAARIEDFVAEQKERYITGEITAEELVQAIDDRLADIQGKKRGDIVRDVFDKHGDHTPAADGPEPGENEE